MYMVTACRNAGVVVKVVAEPSSRDRSRLVFECKHDGLEVEGEGKGFATHLYVQE